MIRLPENRESLCFGSNVLDIPPRAGPPTLMCPISWSLAFKHPHERLFFRPAGLAGLRSGCAGAADVEAAVQGRPSSWESRRATLTAYHVSLIQVTATAGRPSGQCHGRIWWTLSPAAPSILPDQFAAPNGTVALEYSFR